MGIDDGRVGKETVSLVRNEQDSDDYANSYDLKYHWEDGFGYHDNNINIKILEDGAMSLSDDDDIESGLVYLYAEQVELLKKLLRSKRGKRNGNQEGQESGRAQQGQDGVPQQQQNNTKAQGDARPAIQRARRSRGLC